MTTATPAVSRDAASATRPATLQWGILGTGSIAKAFANGLKQSKSGKLVAVGSRSQASAEKFGGEHGIPNRHASYEALLADPQVQAVYIATPHPLHPEWVIKAAKAGKHILVEKPIALNHPQAMAMVEAAREGGVFLMEAFMYRCHPQTAKLVELIRSGAIGQVRMIQATFGFNGGFNPESRLFSNRLGGGGILDVGCYAVSMSRLIAGAAVGKDFANPTDVVGLGQVGTTGVDEYAAGVLKFNGPEGEPIIAQVATAVRASLENVVRVVGTEGSIFVPNPWTADREKGGEYVIHVTRKGQREEIKVSADATAFALEADAVAAAIAAGRTQAFPPAMTWDDSLGNIQTLDRWRQALGQQYEAETPEGFPRPVHGGALRRRDDHNMKYGRVPGLDKDVSKFVFGCDNQSTFAHAGVVFDDWFERGGNAFDTSYIYGGGRPERLLGQWMKSRGVRDQCVVLGKGLHTPNCYPQNLRPQVSETLERIQSDHLDIYIMHRDNLDVPVGEFVDALNELRDLGWFKVMGGSNWTLERFKAANEYAKKAGKQGMTILNNNLSLARMVKPVWGGCITSSDPAILQYLKETQTVHFAWSSQARGYFLPEGERLKLGQDNFECWDSEENRARRERAYQLAEKKGVSPINIAAAYVLCQPFPSFALIGPRTVHETATSMPAMDIELTPEEVEWLAKG